MNPLRILVVDDDKDFAESVGDLIELEGHQPILAHNGMDALKLFKQNNVDIILVDFKMPGLNGIETLMEIRKLNSTVPVVMMTAYANDKFISDATKQGAMDILNKPFNNESLMNIIAGISNLQNILLLDDDEDFANSLSVVLVSEGYKVNIAYNTKQAEKYISGNNIQLLILDIRINGKTGIDIWHIAREKYHDIPTIFISGYTDDFFEQIEQIIKKSHTGVLNKPFSPEELMEKIKTININ